MLNALIRLEEEVLAVAELLQLRLARAVVDRVLLPVVLLPRRPLLSRRFECLVQALRLATLIVEDHLLDLKHGGPGHLGLARGGGLPTVGGRLVGRVDDFRVPGAPRLQVRSWHAALRVHLGRDLQARTGIDNLWLRADDHQLVRPVLLRLLIDRACTTCMLLVRTLKLL